MTQITKVTNGSDGAKRKCLVFLVHTSSVISVITGAKRYLEILASQHSTDSLQKKKKVILGTSRIISRVFIQFETRSLSGGVHLWLKEIVTREKYLRLEEMMTMINKRKTNPAENINS
jgi:hypothetical protein